MIPSAMRRAPSSRSYDVDLAHIRRERRPATGIAIIKVGEGGQNMIWSSPAPMLAVDASDVAQRSAMLANARVLLLQLEVPLAASLAAAEIVRAKRRHGHSRSRARAESACSRRQAVAAIDIVTPE